MASGSDGCKKKKIFWSDRMTRIMLELYVLEKQAGHTKGGNLSDIGKLNLIREFNKIFEMNLDYGKIKNRIDTLKRDYYIYSKITYGATGLGFNPINGTLQAPDHWWKSKIETYPEAERLRTNPLKFIPLLDVVCGDVTVIVEKSWQPRRGLEHHAPPVEMGENEEDGEDNEVQATMQDSTHGPSDTHEAESMSEMPNSSDRPNTSNVPGPGEAPSRPSSRANSIGSAGQKKKRKLTHMETTIERIAITMEERNEYLERLTSRHVMQSGSSIEERMANVVNNIKAVPNLVPMSPLYWASLNLIATNDIMRGVFLALPDEKKLAFVMVQTNESRNAVE